MEHVRLSGARGRTALAIVLTTLTLTACNDKQEWPERRSQWAAPTGSTTPATPVASTATLLFFINCLGTAGERYAENAGRGQSSYGYNGAKCEWRAACVQHRAPPRVAQVQRRDGPPQWDPHSC